MTRNDDRPFELVAPMEMSDPFSAVPNGPPNGAPVANRRTDVLGERPPGSGRPSRSGGPRALLLVGVVVAFWAVVGSAVFALVKLAPDASGSASPGADGADGSSDASPEPRPVGAGFEQPLPTFLPGECVPTVDPDDV